MTKYASGNAAATPEVSVVRLRVPSKHGACLGGVPAGASIGRYRGHGPRALVFHDLWHTFASHLVMAGLVMAGVELMTLEKPHRSDYRDG